MRLQPNIILRCLIVGALAGWVLWAYGTGNSLDHRIREVNAALTDGKLGDVGETDEKTIRETMQWLFRSAGIADDTWTLNEPTDRTKLAIFISTPAAIGITHCGAGNAVYDAQLDAIFIDESLVQGITFISNGAGELFRRGWDNSAMYFAFTIMHELGHRQKRHGTSALFDADGTRVSEKARQMEIEADQFALEALESAYKFDFTNGRQHIDGQAEEYPFSGQAIDDPPAEPRSELLLDLTQLVEEGFLSQTTQGFYSPFYFDQAHPNFANRLKNLFGVIAEGAKSTDLDKAVRRSRDTLARVDNISATLVAEVKFPFDVAALYLADHIVWAVSPSGEWAVSQLPEDSDVETGRYRRLHASTTEQVPPIPLQNSTVLEIAGDRTEPALAIDDLWRLYLRKGEKWSITELRPGGKQKDRVYRSVWRDEGTGVTALVSSDGHPMFDAPTLHVIYPDGRSRAKSFENIANELKIRLKFPQQPLINFGSIDDQFICLGFFDRDDLELIRLRGAVLLKHDLSIETVMLMSENAALSSISQPVVVRDAATGDLVVAGDDLDKGGVAVWDVPKDGFAAAKLRGRILRLGERLDDEDGGTYDNSFIYSASVQEPGSVLHIALWHDSYFAFGQDSTPSAIFHPGFGVVSRFEQIVAINPGLPPNWGRNTFILSTKSKP
ncbi:hypothetical protein GOL29_28015 [Sinorhizobium medicae]|nr:hypothetical protein [Sinorhizobium medicae]